MPPDFVDSFVETTRDVSSPEIFRLWTAITTLAGAMERRCWVRTRKGAIFPNMINLLVSSPGLGKTEAINLANTAWRGTKNLWVAPKRLSSAAFMDSLKEAEKIKVGKHPLPNYEFHSLQCPLPEFGTFLLAHDTEMLNIINDVYDCPGEFGEKRRHNNEGKELNVVAPQLTMLAGTQPAFLARMLPEEAWGMGFTSRIVMIYSGTQDEKGSLWGTNEELNLKPLISRLTAITNMYGEFKWTEAAKMAMDLWYRGGMLPQPDHSKLVNYLPRRILHGIKCVMISGLSRTGQLQIDVEDVTRGLQWLITAEKVMPDIFREMVQRSDADLIQEMHYALWRAYISGKQEPLHQSLIWSFLQQRAPSEKIPRIIEVAEKAHFIKRSPLSNEHWIPQPRQVQGME